MRKNILIRFLFVFAMLAIFAVSAYAVSTHTVYARVVSGTEAIQAVLEPGEFTVPSGSTAVIKKFQHDNPEFDTTEAFRVKFMKDDLFISRVSGFESGEKAKKA